MRAIDRHPRARRDLIEIWFYTFDQWGGEQADHYLRGIDAAIRQLAENPFLGADFGHVRKGIRRHSAGRHRIFYRVNRQTIEIVRVLHASMDFQDHLPGNEN